MKKIRTKSEPILSEEIRKRLENGQIPIAQENRSDTFEEIIFLDSDGEKQYSPVFQEERSILIVDIVQFSMKPMTEQLVLLLRQLKT